MSTLASPIVSFKSCSLVPHQARRLRRMLGGTGGEDGGWILYRQPFGFCEKEIDASIG
ncbi:hypothetical protein ABRZ24_11815 [Brenneria populi]|uniref:Uncharacterized protein n=1 Tax=Brenneria populi TaxID=1505588 RepID=A0ABU6JRF0_9GAMM|nr:hypothetical protein [Brenneria populi Li et al. 2015]